MPEQPCSFHPDRLTAVTCTSCGRPICPQDMIEAPVGYHCPICTGRARPGSLGAASYRARAGVERRLDRLPLARKLRGAAVSHVMIAANVAIFLGMLATGQPTSARTLLRFGALPPILPHDQWWRLITSMFVHIGFAHLLFNMFALWLFGPSIEQRYGRVRFLGLYLTSGFLGAAFSLAFAPGGIAAGASGAVFGILGAWLAVFLRHRRVRGASQQLRSIIFLIGINLLFGATTRGIDNYAHLGGLAAGFAVAMAHELAANVPKNMRALPGLASFAAIVLAGLAVMSGSGRFV